MPYIDKYDRALVENTANGPRNPGELNYAITMLLINYIVYKGKSYTFMNDCLGALEGAKLEFYRRAVAPYEDAKIKENGDVY